jgi:hypothetical protein
VKATDKERVRNWLLLNGSTTQLDWQAGRVVDGGKPILRLAPRIYDLRADGMDIETAVRRPVALYVLPEPVVTDVRGQTRLTVAETTKG